MALRSTYLISLAILFSVTTAYNSDLEEIPCSTPAQQQFRNKYCQHLVNGTAVTNEHDFSAAFGICFDELVKRYEMAKLFLFGNYEHLICKEIVDCLNSLWSVFEACAEMIGRVLPEELKNPQDPVNRMKLQGIAARMQTARSAFYAVFGILFIVGLAANGFLIIIFSRHKNARNDAMLINLTAADVLSLIINLPVFIAMISLKLTFTDIFRAFTFGSRLCIFISEYTLVIISFERFKAVSMMKNMRKDTKFPAWVKITCLWILGSIYGFLCYLFLEAFFGQWTSFVNIMKVARVLMCMLFIIECILPVVLISVFSVLASIRLKELAKNFPGDKRHHVERINNRYLTAKALIALVVLFLVSYMPYHIVVLTFSNYYLDIENALRNVLDFETWMYISMSTYAAMLLNSTFNPLVLYFVSSKFRRYFKSYCYCRAHELDEEHLVN